MGKSLSNPYVIIAFIMARKFEIKEIKEKALWNPLLINKRIPFTQSFEYGSWQEMSGRKVRRFCIEENHNPLVFVQFIFFTFNLGKTYGYAPYGPAVSEFSKEVMAEVKEICKKVAKEEKAFFVRLDFSPPANKNKVFGFFNKVPLFSYSGSSFQPRYEWLLSLESSEEKLLSEMHQKARYSVRLAEKKGVTVEIVTEHLENYFDDFLKLMEETAFRNEFKLHEKEYYKNIFSESKENKNIYLSIARFEGKILVIDFVFIFGETAMYIFGASSNEHKNLSAPHLAQFRALLHAKKLGAKVYNFGGVEDPERKLVKGWEGLTSFKQKFGGRLFKHSDLYDHVQNPFWYAAYTLRKFLKKFIK